MTDTAAAEAPAKFVPPEAAEPEEAAPEKTARERILDFLEDTEGPQSVEQILAGTGLNRNACEQAIFRAKKAEQIIWVAPGVYALAPPKPLPSSRNGHSNEEWVARIEAWQVNPAFWNVEQDGPPPNDPNHRIPLDVVGRFKDRQAREAAAAKQEAADAALRDQLIAATGGNFTPGPGIQDISPIKVALELVPLDYILSAIRHKTDRKCYPKNEPATSWSESRLLRKIAEDYCQFTVVPSLVAAWTAAGTGPGPTTRVSPPPAGSLPDDIDDLRSHHDSEHAPPGPHSLPGPNVTGEPVDRSEPSPGTPGARGAGKRIHGATGAACRAFK